MPTFLLLKHYRGGPELPTPVPPMPQWDPQDIEAHLALLGQVAAMLKESGEYVDGQALTSRAGVRPVRGAGRRPGAQRGPAPGDQRPGRRLVRGRHRLRETGDRDHRVRLVRAGPGGKPLYERIDVRPVTEDNSTLPEGW